MTTAAEQLERDLRRDLQRLAGRLADQDLWDGLYRTLANRSWENQAKPGHVAVSWKLAEEIVNDLRASQDLPPVELAQTGGEGVPDATVESHLQRVGWDSAPLDTSRHDDAHLDSPPDEPRTPVNTPIPRHRKD